MNDFLEMGFLISSGEARLSKCVLCRGLDEASRMFEVDRNRKEGSPEVNGPKIDESRI